MVGMFTRYKRQIILFLFLFGFSLYVYVGVGGPNILYQDRYPNQETHLRDIPLTLTGEDHVLRKDVMVENDANLHIRVQLNSVYVKQKSLTNKITVKRNERIISHHGNKRSKNQPYRDNDKRENHPLNGASDGRKIHPQRASYMRKTHPHRTSHGRHIIKLHRAKKLKLSDKHGGHKKSAELSEADDNIENKKQNKLCHVPFAYGQMCPVLYTDLGGYCNINKTAPQGFDCPDIRKKGYNQLRSTQLVLTRLLKIFDLVARKHGIKYWITSGTLLGAVRHRGFIPWDEDADIQMTLADYIKLFKCCKNEFPDGIFFQNSETDPYLRPSNETENHLQRHPVVGLYRATWNPRLRDTKSCTRYCLSYGCGWVDGLMIDIFIAEDTLHPYHLSKLFPLKVMLFEGFHLPVPNNWKEILKYKYGNYASEYGEYSKRIPEDNSDPFHSCEELKRAKGKRKKQ